MGSELGLLLSISLSGYGMAFAIIALIVAIPYILLRREVAPKQPPSAPSEARAAEEAKAGASKDLELLAAAVAAAIYVHTSRARRAPRARAYAGYAPVSGWIVAARIDQMTTLERGWGGRSWRTYRS